MYVDPNRNQAAGNLKWIMPYCKPDLPRVGGAIALFVVNDTMALSIPLVTGMLVDRVITGGETNLLIPLCVAMIIMTLIRVASRYGYVMFMERFGQNTIFRLVSDEYEKLHKLDFTYFNHTRTGDIMSRMTSDTDAIRHALSWVSYNILDCVVMFVGALCVMFAIDWRLALVLAAITPPLFVLTRALSGRARPLFLAIRNSLAELNSMVEENIEGNRVVKAFVREPFETEKFDAHNDDYMNRNMAQAYNTARFMPWLDGLGFSLQLITLGLGGFLVIRGYMTLGNLVSFNSFLWMLDGPVRQSGWLVNDWQRFNASCVKIRKLLTAESHIDDPAEGTASAPASGTSPVTNAVPEAAGSMSAPTSAPAPAAARTIRGDVRFEHVDFAFPDDPDTPILKDIDFTLPAGAKLGILGETGSGKSTLVNLVCRFYDPTAGRVLVDGTDARDWPLATLRSKVCVVAQDTFLFSDTIGGNILFGASNSIDSRNNDNSSNNSNNSDDNNADDDRCCETRDRDRRDDDYIRRMAAIAGADRFISALPDGYDTVVGERGVGLSGGQKQRLSLARALADNPSILIMDDTTSAVDMETEADIQRHLAELDEKKTIITIAHRISSVKDADLILVLEHGRIVERGTHDELVKAHGRYWDIYHKQLGLAAGRAQGFEE